MESGKTVEIVMQIMMKRNDGDDADDDDWNDHYDEDDAGDDLDHGGNWRLRWL